jgi:Histidine kinase-, DNA gyrase B-, and HSP90-like ATPase
MDDITDLLGGAERTRTRPRGFIEPQTRTALGSAAPTLQLESSTSVNADFTNRGTAADSALPSLQLAESSSSVHADFTNCGKAELQKLRKSQKQIRKLTRVPFQVSRLMEFCNERELVNQTGHSKSEWPLVVLKELVDNALDECEEAGIAPVIEIVVDGNRISIFDNGRGIPAKTIKSVLDYSIRVSSREAYVSPTRGAQGNALKTIMPMAYVLDNRGEDAAGETIIEAHGTAHRILFSVDHIGQEPKIQHTMTASVVTVGTTITVELPGLLVTEDNNPYYWVRGRREPSGEVDRYLQEIGVRQRPETAASRFLQLAESYAWLNPHLTLGITWNGECLVDVKASDSSWSKWLPSWPTSAHWYDTGRLRRYMAAHIKHSGAITVREFISEFDGMSGTAKQKIVLAETGASHVSLCDWPRSGKFTIGVSVARRNP